MDTSWTALTVSMTTAGLETGTEEDTSHFGRTSRTSLEQMAIGSSGDVSEGNSREKNLHELQRATCIPLHNAIHNSFILLSGSIVKSICVPPNENAFFPKTYNEVLLHF